MRTHLCWNKHYQLLQKDRTEHTRRIHLFLSPRCFQISILSVLFSPQEYQIDIIFAQTWVDTRLRFNSSSSMRLTLNRYAGFTADKQLYYKFPHVSFSWRIPISIYQFFKWTPSHCCDSSFSTAATVVFPHFHTVNISFENNIPPSLGKRPVINGTNWLMCFVFPVSPGYFIILLLGSGAASCISEKSGGFQQQSLLTFCPSVSVSLSLCLFCLLSNQQHGRLDLAARHHL